MEMQGLFRNTSISLSLIIIANFFARQSSPSPVADTVVHERASLRLLATPFFSFPDNNQAENIISRVNGQILVTINTAPQLYQIDPSRNQSGGIVHQFQGYTSLFGIVELQTDVFYVIASNFTSAPDYFGIQDSASIFEVDLHGIPDPTTAQSAVKVSKIVDVPQAQLLDGFGVVNHTAGLMITGDAQTGTLYLIDVYRRSVTAVLQDVLLKGTSDGRAAGIDHIGINGLKVYRDDLYFTNTAKGTFGKVPLDSVTGRPAGELSVLANYGTLTDDLSFDLHGNAFISEPLNGVLLRPANTTPKRNQTKLLTSLYGANSNAFGRTRHDTCILYSTFDGLPSGVARIDVADEGICNGKILWYAWRAVDSRTIFVWRRIVPPFHRISFLRSNMCYFATTPRLDTFIDHRGLLQRGIGHPIIPAVICCPVCISWARVFNSFTSQFAQTNLPLKKLASGLASHTKKCAGSFTVGNSC